jgi:hypothetical protein
MRACTAAQGADVKYIDPTYMIRAVPTNPNDRIYCKARPSSIGNNNRENSISEDCLPAPVYPGLPHGDMHGRILLACYCHMVSFSPKEH